VTAPQPVQFRIAPVFDAVDDAGRPYFSPDRWRVVDGAARGRLAAYLSQAPMAVRAYGLEPDPLDPSRGPAVPVGYLTDGVWVWQEAAGYYLESLGVAPEDDLVAHIASTGYAPPSSLPNDLLLAAADAAVAPSLPPPPDARRDLRYYADVTSGGTADSPGGLVRTWRERQPDGNEVRIDQTCGLDLRWHDTTALMSAEMTGNDRDLVELSVRQAAAVIDRWWTADHT
jgi:hypothetical protein